MSKLETYTRDADSRGSEFTYEGTDGQPGTTVRRVQPARMQRTLAEHWADVVRGLKLGAQ